MARYRFHCTNGYECVLDAQGAEVRAPGRLIERARRVARDVMRDLEAHTDWSEWRVTVHDLKGRRVLLQPFPGGLPDSHIWSRSHREAGRHVRDRARTAPRSLSRAGEGWGEG